MKSLTLILLFFFPLIASAEPQEIPNAIDFERREAEAYRFEISPYGGDYFGDKLNHSFIVGNNLQFNLNPWWGLSADFGYSQLSVDSTSAFGASIVEKNEYLIDTGIVFNLPAAWGTKKSVTEMDFFTSLGGGILRINDSNRAGGYLGGGIKIRFKKTPIAIRVEVRDHFTSIPNPSGSDFENDLTIRIGPTFLLPPRIKKK